MRQPKRCPRIQTELWTPGSHQQPDGPSRTMRGRCVLDEDHEQYADTPRHIYGDWLEVGK